jgi:hypothetical protein
MQNLVLFLRTTYPNLDGEARPVVKICLVDDGVDPLAPPMSDLGDVVASGRLFSHRPGHSDMTTSWYISSGRHGTKMARLIYQNTVGVWLFVARVDVTDGKLAQDQVIKVHFFPRLLFFLHV